MSTDILQASCEKQLFSLSFMASAFEEGPVGGFPFFIAGVSLLSACFVAFCAACRRKDKSELSSQDEDEQESVDEVAVPGLAATLALGGSAPNLQPGSGSDSGIANIRPAPLTLPRLSNKDGSPLGGCSIFILPQRDLPTVPCSPEMTYSNLNFPKRGEEILCESRKVEGEESKNGHPAADKIAQNVPGHQPQAAGPSYACVVKKKKKEKKEKEKKEKDDKPTWVEMEKCQEISLPTEMWPPPPATKAMEEMYSVVCKEKKKKKDECSEGAGQERDPQAEVNSGHHRGITVSQESNGIASYQSSVLPTATEPYYESVPCESWTEVASRPRAEPAYESVDTYWNKEKKKAKSSEKNMAIENFYESIDLVAFQGQGQGRTLSGH